MADDIEPAEESWEEVWPWSADDPRRRELDELRALLQARLQQWYREHADSLERTLGDQARPPDILPFDQEGE